MEKFTENQKITIAKLLSITLYVILEECDGVVLSKSELKETYDSFLKDIEKNDSIKKTVDVFDNLIK